LKTRHFIGQNTQFSTQKPMLGKVRDNMGIPATPPQFARPKEKTTPEFADNIILEHCIGGTNNRTK